MERVLRLATWLAAALLAAGLGLWLGHAAAAEPLMHAGLWLLIATPIARAVAALVDYLRARDWTFFWLTAIVIACLTLPIVTFFLSLPD